MATASRLRRLVLLAPAVVALLWVVAYLIARAVGPDVAPPVDGPPLAGGAADTVRIAPPDVALTLARVPDGDRLRLVRVVSYRAGRVTAVDLGALAPDARADPLAALQRHGLRALVAAQGPELQVDASRLAVPFDGPAVHVAAGVNYPAHGSEVGVTRAFLFPKHAPLAHHRAAVAVRDRLLDYEIELGVVALGPMSSADAPLGLVLASDYTDRDRLLRTIDLFDTESGEGFTTGKSGDDLMPIGNLLVVPFDLDTYVRGLVLELWLNGRRRQVAEPARMVWDPRRLVDETLRGEARRWRHGGGVARLPVQGGTIPAGTLLLSGTPDGTVFRSLSARHRFLGVTEWLVSLRWGDTNRIVGPYLREARAAGHYLRGGDSVVMRADGLGVIVNPIVDAPVAPAAQIPGLAR